MTIREIAKHIGVGASTVSLVLNNKPGVRKEMREKITNLLIENGYAIRENTQKTAAHGEVKLIRYLSSNHTSERNEDFFVGVLNGAEKRTRELGNKFSLSSATASQLPDLLQSLEKQDDLLGVVFLASELSASQIPHLVQFSKPLVVVDMPIELDYYPINGINSDNEGGILEAVQNLCALGHRRIGFLRGETEIGGLYSRYLAYRKALDMHNIEINEDYILQIDPQYEVAIQEMKTYLQQKPHLPTAFLAANDIIAAGCVNALTQAGYRVPEDVSVVGFDDGAMSTFISPPLTTMRVNRMRTGELAVERIIALKNNPNDNVIKSTVSVSWIARGSTQPI